MNLLDFGHQQESERQGPWPLGCVHVHWMK